MLKIETIKQMLKDRDCDVRTAAMKACQGREVPLEIIGNLCGEKVGISMHDKKTCYRVGDVIEIKDFDYSDAKCSTGFHFFCTKKQAEEF